jgi:hypothetical protein
LDQVDKWANSFYDPVKRNVMPLAPNEDKANLRITFSRKREQVMSLAAELLEYTGADPGEVGAAAFDDCYCWLVNGKR